MISRRTRLLGLLGAILVVAACQLAACGRRAAVRPPEDILPTTISDLKVVRKPDGVQLSWGRPTTYTGGARMGDLGGFEVLRAEGHGDFQRLTILELTDRGRFRQAKKIQYLDRGISAGQTYLYRVVSFTLDGYVSAPSNIATVETTPDTGESHAPLPTPRR